MAHILPLLLAACVCAAVPGTALPGPSDPAFLQDWMGALYPVVANQSLLDLSLPGTHDSITYDLSTTVSDGYVVSISPLPSATCTAASAFPPPFS